MDAWQSFRNTQTLEIFQVLSTTKAIGGKNYRLNNKIPIVKIRFQIYMIVRRQLNRDSVDVLLDFNCSKYYRIIGGMT